jgi:toxin YoeB
LEFERKGFEDLSWWIAHDPTKAQRIMRLILETSEDPFRGIGKPEPLKRQLSGCWSRRINEKHRLVYKVFEDRIRILACRYHY